MTTTKPDLDPAARTRHTKVKPAYWLEYEGRIRATRLYKGPEGPLRTAGRVLENTGALTGFALVHRDADDARRIVATGVQLEEHARPHIPQRRPEDAERDARFIVFLRSSGFREPREETDERVYE